MAGLAQPSGLKVVTADSVNLAAMIVLEWCHVGTKSGHNYEVRSEKSRVQVRSRGHEMLTSDSVKLGVGAPVSPPQGLQNQTKQNTCRSQHVPSSSGSWIL